MPKIGKTITLDARQVPAGGLVGREFRKTFGRCRGRPNTSKVPDARHPPHNSGHRPQSSNQQPCPPRPRRAPRRGAPGAERLFGALGVQCVSSRAGPGTRLPARLDAEGGAFLRTLRSRRDSLGARLGGSVGSDSVVLARFSPLDAQSTRHPPLSRSRRRPPPRRPPRRRTPRRSAPSPSPRPTRSTSTRSSSRSTPTPASRRRPCPS